MLVKICGLRTQQDMDVAAQGAQMCGFIFANASPRGISFEAAARLHSYDMLRVGVFVDEDVETLQQAVRVARLDLVQLHGSQSVRTAQALREMPSGNSTGQALEVIRVLWPDRYASVHDLEADMRSHAVGSDYFLLDAGTRGGGTGHVLAWKDLQNLQSPRPWLLAGGLHAGNVRAALNTCTPQGVDFNSGLEQAKGHKDAHKIAAAFASLKGYCHE